MLSAQIMAAMLAVGGVGETVLLDFCADWCGPCKMMEPTVDRLASMGYPVRKVNIDNEPALARQYGVSSVPCFVLLVNGQERGRQVGATSMGQLVTMINQAGIRPPAGDTVAQVRGQSPGRGRMGWPRSKAAPAPTIRPPLVSLGQEVPSPHRPAAPTVAVPHRPAVPTAPSPPARPRPMDLVAQPKFPPMVPAPPNPAPLVAFGPTPPPLTGTTKSLVDRLIAATVRLRVKDPTGHNYGSGSIIDFRPSGAGGGEALILTCGHIFRDAAGKGTVYVDLFDGSGNQTLVGELVRYDLARDIGLVRVGIPHTVRSVQLAAAGDKPSRGEAVISVGCDHGRNPTVQRSQITAVNSFVGPPNLQASGQPAVGRSGGGLFNERGQLIGVCNFADPTDRAGLYAAVEVARGLMNEAGVMLATSLPPRPPANPPITPVSLPARARTDIGSAASIRPLATKAGPLDRMNPNPTEVICVVRNGRDGNTQRQVLVIEDASPELLKRLAAEQQRQQGAFPTTMEVPLQPLSSLPSSKEVIRTTTDWQPKWR